MFPFSAIAPLRLAAVSLLAWLLLVVAPLATAPVVHAQEPAPSVEQKLDAARKQIDAARERLGEEDVRDTELRSLRDQVRGVEAEAVEIADALGPELAGVEARLQELGAPVAGETEARDVAAQRDQLDRTRGRLDAQVKLARLLAVEAEQLLSDILAAQRAGFQASLGERTASILGERFWEELAAEAPQDLEGLNEFIAQLRAAADEVPGRAWALVLAAVTLVVAVRLWAGRRLLALTASRVPAGRLRRSFHAVAVVGLSLLTPVAIARAVTLVLQDHGSLPDAIGELLDDAVGALTFGGFVVGLGVALLSHNRPTWRLPPLPDVLATRLRWFPWQLGVVVVAVWLAQQVAGVIDASLATAVLVNVTITIVLGGVLGLALLRGEWLRRQAIADPERYPLPPRHWLISLMVGAAWVALATSFVCLLLGYVAASSFIVRQVAWTLVVLCSAYLLTALVDDGFVTLLGARRHDENGESLGGTRNQVAVLLSGLGRLLVALVALILVFAPVGAGPAELMSRADLLRGGLAIGAVTIRPAAVMQAALVFVLALAAVGILKRWLADSYLPTTSLDPGMRTSAATLFGYAGVVVAVALGMVAGGVGLERVAWVASALSVGIGFGLQAVVQNFVSGLILLAERPVRVGDWVSLGGVEGDIRSINARATEIQMGDRSTLIVPNSEFITKTVRNVTHTNPLGVVSFKLPMPLATDAERAREIILAALDAHDDILASPAPGVFLDGVDGTHLIFSASGYVASPRMAYGVRSAVLFDVLKRLREADIQMLQPATMLMASDPDGAPAAAPQAPAPS